MPEDLAAKVVKYLCQHESATALELSDEIGTDYMSVVDALNHLIEAGLVVWRMGPYGFAYQVGKRKGPKGTEHSGRSSINGRAAVEGQDGCNTPICRHVGPF